MRRGALNMAVYAMSISAVSRRSVLMFAGSIKLEYVNEFNSHSADIRLL
jgi:hypothetical protein